MLGVHGPGTRRVCRTLAPVLILHPRLSPRLRSRTVTLPLVVGEGDVSCCCALHPDLGSRTLHVWLGRGWFATVHLPLRGFRMASARLPSGCLLGPSWLVSCLDPARVSDSGSVEVGKVCLNFVPCAWKWLASVLVWCTLR